MKLAINHKVKSCRFEICTATEEQAYDCVGNIRGMDIQRILGRAFKSFDHTPQWIKIESLEIELGVIEEWNEKLLEEIIIDKVNNIISKQIGNDLKPSQLRTLYISDNAVSVIEDDKNKLEVLLHYLFHGSLPWYGSEALNMNDVLCKLLKQCPQQLKVRLKLILRHHHVQKRLVWIFEENSVLDLIDVLSENTLISVYVRQLHAFTHIVSTSALDKQHNSRATLQSLLDAISRGLSPDALLTSVLTEIKKVLPAISKESLDRIQSVFTTVSDIEREPWRNILLHVETRFNIKITGLPDRKTQPSTSTQLQAGQSDKLSPSYKERELLSENVFTSDEESKDRKQSIDEYPAPDEPVFIDNAGLVLLNASLINRAFQQLGWARNNAFTSEEARHRALIWLHYLTHGEGQAEEYQLVLNKILCGVKPEEITDIKIELTTDEKQEAEEFLNAVIAHWIALKKISTNSLRQSFLKRNGRLKLEDGSWHLHAESMAYDILIERIPWTFSIIKLPWMTKPLFTQWLTRI